MSPLVSDHGVARNEAIRPPADEPPNRHLATILHAVELVIAGGLALIAQRWVVVHSTTVLMKLTAIAWVTVVLTLHPFLFFASTFSLGALIFESLTTRGRVAWGPGRWTWAVAGAVCTLTAAYDLVLWNFDRALAIDPSKTMHFRNGLSTGILAEGVHFVGLTPAVVSVLGARALAGDSCRTPADAREVSGRALLIALILWSLAHYTLRTIFW